MTALAERIHEVQDMLAQLGDGPSEARAMLVGELRGLRFAKSLPAERVEGAPAAMVTVTPEERAVLLGASPAPPPRLPRDQEVAGEGRLGRRRA